MPSLLRAVVASLPLVQLGSCEPRITFPFNAQLPPVARIDEFFTYTFSEYTFQSDSKISFSLGRHPSWLSFESDKRRLYGTPRDEDVPAGQIVGQAVDIIARDSKGGTAMNSTVVISRMPAPKVEIPLASQIKDFGEFSAPASILSYPSTSFKFSFDPKTFGSAALNYYAVSGDSSPLPAWIQFDASTLTFSGKTPPIESLVQPPQTFEFSLVASDIVGFSASALRFAIVVGSHRLTVDNPVIMLNATRGAEVKYAGLQNGVKLDGKQISVGDVAVTAKDMPSWLSFDNQTWMLRGTPNDGDHATNFTITFKDSFSDNLDVMVVVNVATGLFQSTFEDVEIRPGSDFQLDLTKYFRDPNDVTVKVSTSPGEDWLKTAGLKLAGKVPKSSKGSFKLYIDASSKSSDLKEKEMVNISFLAPDGTTTIATSPSSTMTATSSATNTKADPAFSSETDGHLSTGEILLATIIPVIFVAVLLMCLICYFRRRRAQQSYLGSKYRSKISPPIFGTFRTNGSLSSMREARSVGTIIHTEKHLRKPDKAAFADGSSSLSSQSGSSDTLGRRSGSEMPQSMMVDAARTTTIRSVSNVPSEDGRQSWVTIDGVQAGVQRSYGSVRSHQSDATYSETTRQMFSGADYTPSRRDLGRDMMLPTLEELPSVQPTPLLASQEQQRPKTGVSQHSVGGHSAITSSSAALPRTPDGLRNYTTDPVATWHTEPPETGAPSEPNWLALTESEAGESLSSPRKPPAAVLPSLSPPKPWYEPDSPVNGSNLFNTEQSFGSSENWRIIGRHSPTKLEQPYKELVDAALFHPSRPGTAGEDARADEGGRRSLELVSPLPWGEDPHSPTLGTLGLSTSIVSKLSEMVEEMHMSGGRGQETGETLTREHSAKMSDGSYKVFI